MSSKKSLPIIASYNLNDLSFSINWEEFSDSEKEFVGIESFDLTIGPSGDSAIRAEATQKFQGVYTNTDSEFLLTFNETINGVDFEDIKLNYSLVGGRGYWTAGYVPLEESFVRKDGEVIVTLRPKKELKSGADYKLTVELESYRPLRRDSMGWLFSTTPELYVNKSIPIDGSVEVEIPEEVHLFSSI